MVKFSKTPAAWKALQCAFQSKRKPKFTIQRYDIFKFIFAENRYQGQVMKSALKKVKPIPNPTRESVPATTLERAELEDAFDRETKVRSS